MSTIDAILFDMDGALMDSEPLHLRATQFALGDRAGYTEPDDESFFGATDPDLFRILRILFDLDASTDDLVQRKRERLVSLVRAEGRGLPGVPDILLGLRETGLRLGLVSASARPIIDAILETVGLSGAFETVVSGDESPAANRPLTAISWPRAGSPRIRSAASSSRTRATESSRPRRPG